MREDPPLPLSSSCALSICLRPPFLLLHITFYATRLSEEFRIVGSCSRFPTLLLLFFYLRTSLSPPRSFPISDLTREENDLFLLFFSIDLCRVAFSM